MSDSDSDMSIASKQRHQNMKFAVDSMVAHKAATTPSIPSTSPPPQINHAQSGNGNHVNTSTSSATQAVSSHPNSISVADAQLITSSLISSSSSLFAFPAPTALTSPATSTLPPHLLNHPLRVSFLSKLRDNALHFQQRLTATRFRPSLRTTDDDTAIGARHFTVFEKGLEDMLNKYLAMYLSVEDGVWKEGKPMPSNAEISSHFRLILEKYFAPRTAEDDAEDAKRERKQQKKEKREKLEMKAKKKEEKKLAKKEKKAKEASIASSTEIPSASDSSSIPLSPHPSSSNSLLSPTLDPSNKSIDVINEDGEEEKKRKEKKREKKEKRKREREEGEDGVDEEKEQKKKKKKYDAD